MRPTFQATKTRSGRPGWSVTFKHPKRSDSRGKPGLKIRKGLNTQDDAEADRLVAQLNALLADDKWWSIDRRKEAELHFAPVIVAAFFDGMESGKISSVDFRQARLPLPGQDDGYSRVLFVGTTGAGKTTLLRHAIGANHTEDRFPSTSTARTTTAEIEIITAETGPFEAVVTFMPEHEVRTHVDECLEEACLRAAQSQTDEKTIGALLTHREQRFRLSYILGGWDHAAELGKEEDFTFEDTKTVKEALAEGEAVTPNEIKRNDECIKSYLVRIRKIAEDIAAKTSEEFGLLSKLDDPEKRATWFERFGDALHEHGDFAVLAHDIMDQIEDRFERIDSKEFDKEAGRWPTSWIFKSENREDFLKQIRWFSSNHHAQFGRLLTPLVDGIRVRGAFYPTPNNLRVAPKLVLLDGEGIGHTAKAASSISTRITRRFPDVDLILIVDNAEQPMQTAPLELLRSIGSSGHADKVAVAFTHFDLVKGPNLNSQVSKRDHVLGSARDTISTLRQALGVPVASQLESRIENCSFFLGGLDREIEGIPKGFQDQIRDLLQLMQNSGVPAEPVDAAPIYSGEGLEIALRDAVEGFQLPWKARLGLTYHDGIAKEHWTRVKALARRLAKATANEYDDLRPVADLVKQLQESISRWLDGPASWTRLPVDNAERNAALSPIRQSVNKALHDLAELRLADLHRLGWTAAFDHSGPGSSYRRADEIQGIYAEAAPVISSAMSEPARAFLHALYKLVREAVVAAGGNFRVDGQP